MELTAAFLGERIARARERFGLSQGRLAERIGLTQSAISRIESGERSVEALELSRIARSLDVSVIELLEEHPLLSELLVAARVEQPGSPECAGLERALARVVDLVQLDRLIGGNASAEALACDEIEVGATADPVAEGAWLANHVRAEWGLDDDPLPMNLESLIEDLSGLSVALEPLGEQVAGLYAYVEDVAIALVDSSVPVGRQRFTVVHELCHCLLRDDERLIVDQALTGRSRAERRANAFAAHFLMPEQSIRRYLRHRDPDEEVVVELIYTFGVSLQALLWQLVNLGLVSEGKRRRLQKAGPKALSIRYGYGDAWEWFESEQDVTRPPRRLRERATSAYDEGAIGIEPLADLLGRSDTERLRRELEDQGIGAREAWWEETTPG